MAGSWSNSYQTSLTLPSGATSGARIVLDGESDTILVYDDTNALIASVAPADGTDPFGNTVLFGITQYTGGEYIQMGFGNFLLGILGVAGANPGELSIIGDNSAVALLSPNGPGAHQGQISYLELHSGDTSAGTGAATMPHTEARGDIWVNVQDTATQPFNNFSILACTVPPGQGNPIPVTKKDATMGTGWAQGTGIGGAYPNLQFWRDPMDNERINGVFHATSTTPSTLIATGLDKVSGSSVSPAGPATLLAASGQTIACYLNMNGELRAQALPTIAVNNTFILNATVPLRNLA